MTAQLHFYFCEFCGFFHRDYDDDVCPFCHRRARFLSRRKRRKPYKPDDVTIDGELCISESRLGRSLSRRIEY